MDIKDWVPFPPIFSISNYLCLLWLPCSSQFKICLWDKKTSWTGLKVTCDFGGSQGIKSDMEYHSPQKIKSVFLKQHTGLYSRALLCSKTEGQLCAEVWNSRISSEVRAWKVKEHRNKDEVWIQWSTLRHSPSRAISQYSFLYGAYTLDFGMDGSVQLFKHWVGVSLSLLRLFFITHF